MKTRATCAILALTLAAGLSACDDGEEAVQEDAMEAPAMDAPAAQQVPPEAMALMTEMQQVQSQLEPIAQQAMQDEELAARLTRLQERIQEELREADPEAMERADDLQGRIQAAGDDPMQQQGLMAEAQTTQREMQALMAEVMQQPEIQSAVEEFEAAQREKMIEIDPQAEELLARLDSLNNELRQHAPPGMMGQPMQ